MCVLFVRRFGTWRMNEVETSEIFESLQPRGILQNTLAHSHTHTHALFYLVWLYRFQYVNIGLAGDTFQN